MYRLILKAEEGDLNYLLKSQLMQKRGLFFLPYEMHTYILVGAGTFPARPQVHVYFYVNTIIMNTQFSHSHFTKMISRNAFTIKHFSQ